MHGYGWTGEIPVGCGCSESLHVKSEQGDSTVNCHVPSMLWIAQNRVLPPFQSEIPTNQSMPRMGRRCNERLLTILRHFLSLSVYEPSSTSWEPMTNPSKSQHR